MDAQASRAQIVADYDVDERGMIRSPGKFESEMLYVPYFWGITLDGATETIDFADGARLDVVEIDQEDRAAFPEIPDDAFALVMEETESGFVNSRCVTETELAEIQARADSEVDEDSEGDESEG